MTSGYKNIFTISHKTRSIRNIQKYLTAACFLFSTIGLKAQNISSGALVWEVDACLDVSTGISNEATDQILSYGNERIEWRDGAGSVKATFEIIEVNGQWANVRNNGAIVYEVRCDGRPGTIQFSRAEGKHSIRIILLKPSEDPDIHRLSVSTVTTP
jgi:hypothetical protein